LSRLLYNCISPSSVLSFVLLFLLVLFILGSLIFLVLYDTCQTQSLFKYFLHQQFFRDRCEFPQLS
jgi:Trk-type K+ transport system membrane component